MPKRFGLAHNLVRRYFQVKARQVAAIAHLPVCEHPGLIGSHREELYRIYLREVLPRRFEVGRGMVYSKSRRSREADIVVWDSLNYPSLPMLDHSFFFAESVRLVLECKSSWSSGQFKDVLGKCRAVRDIISLTGPTMADALDMLGKKVAALHQENAPGSVTWNKHHIGTAAVFLSAGSSVNLGRLATRSTPTIDASWPDLLLLLEPGLLAIKNYQPGDDPSRHGRLEVYRLGADALLGFTTVLLALLTERSVQFESPLYLTPYAPVLADAKPAATVYFPCTRSPPQRILLWRQPSDA